MTEEPVVLRGSRFREAPGSVRSASPSCGSQRGSRAAAGVAAGCESGDLAWAEAAGAKLQGSETPVHWGDAFVPESLGALERLCYERGRSSIDVLRAEPQLLSSLQIGTWFSAAWRTPTAPAARSRPAHGASRPHRRAAAAGGAARRRRMVLGRSAFTRDRGRVAPADEQLLRRALLPPARRHGPPIEHDTDLPPVRFARQLALLRRLGYQPLSVEASTRSTSMAERRCRDGATC